MSNNKILSTTQSNNIAQNQGQFNLSSIEVINGKVNLTKLAQSQGKDIRAYLRSKGGKEFIQCYQAENPDVQILHIRKGDSATTEQGTFGTRELALEVSRWISPKFSVWCAKQIDKLLQTGKVEIAIPQSKMDLVLQFQEALNLAVETIQEKDLQLALQAPKVSLADNYLVNGANMNLSTCAKSLNIKVKDLTALLYTKPYIFESRGNKVPYSEYQDWFYCKPFVANNGHTGSQLLVTPIGLEKLSRLLQPKNLIQRLANSLNRIC